MEFWTFGAVVGTVSVMVIGVVYGAVRQQPTERPELPVVMAAVGGAISMVWVAAGAMVLHALK